MIHNVSIASDGCPAARGDGSDDRAAIQAHIDFLAQHGGGGLYCPGQYAVGSPGIRLKNSIRLHADSQAGKISALGNHVTVTADGIGTKVIEDIFLEGYMGANPTAPTLLIEANAEVFVNRIKSWGGVAGIRNYGNDGTIENSFLWGQVVNAENHGSLWWKRVKFDSIAGFQQQIGFISGAGASENYCEQCDFSGDYPVIVDTDDGGANKAVYKFTNGCIFGSTGIEPGIVRFGSALWVAISGATFGVSSIVANCKNLTLTDSFSLETVQITGSCTRREMSNNINILP